MGVGGILSVCLQPQRYARSSCNYHGRPPHSRCTVNTLAVAIGGGGFGYFPPTTTTVIDITSPFPFLSKDPISDERVHWLVGAMMLMAGREGGDSQMVGKQPPTLSTYNMGNINFHFASAASRGGAAPAAAAV